MRSLLLAVLLLSPLAAPSPEPADLLLTGGRVWTAEAGAPIAQAVAVRDGRVVFVGSDAEAARWQGPKTRVVALGGRLVVPGFEDAHLHLMSGARNLERVDLSAETTLEIFAFMAAADESKRRGGAPVTLQEMMDKARKGKE